MMGFMDEVGDLQSANGRRRPAGTRDVTVNPNAKQPDPRYWSGSAAVDEK